MRKRLAILVAVTALLLAGAAPVAAAPPCNDSDADGSPSGAEYAAHHIVPLATTGGLGNGGHKPGDHRGFSLCDPSNL